MTSTMCQRAATLRCQAHTKAPPPTSWLLIAISHNGTRLTTKWSPPGFGRELHFLETSLKRVLDFWIECQSGTGTKSEHSVKVIYLRVTGGFYSEAGCTLANSENKRGIAQGSIGLEEVWAEEDTPDSTGDGFVLASILSVHLLQQLELPNLVSKNVTVLHPSFEAWQVCYCALVYWTFYIGQVLDLYKRGAKSRYGSLSSWHRLHRVFLGCHYVFTYLYNWCVSLISFCSYLTFLS